MGEFWDTDDKKEFELPIQKENQQITAITTTNKSVTKAKLPNPTQNDI